MDGTFEGRDDNDTRVIGRTPGGSSMTRMYSDHWSSSVAQPMPAVRIHDINRERASNHAINVEAHDAGVERAFNHIMNMEVYDTDSKNPDPLSCVATSNNGVERAHAHHREDLYSIGVVDVGEVDANVGAHHSTIDRASDYPVTDTAHESSLGRPSDLPLRALLREQEDREQQPSLSFPHTLDKESQDILTKVTQVAPSGANNEPLGLVVRKRGAPEPEEASRPMKVRRTGNMALADATAAHDRILIDLTEPDRYVPPHRRQPVLSNITNTQNTGYTVTTRTNSKGGTTTNLTFNPPKTNERDSRAQRRQQRAAAAAADHKISRAETASKMTFNKVFNRLSTFRTQLRKDRESLSACWEADAKMKEPEMMDRMQELGDYMRQIDDAVARAVGVVRSIK
ncbi:hypothetical protein MMC18_001738 [Xylographa bjoerkii]|nr:hypothetical protein [Xylographa bjoerkii]